MGEYNQALQPTLLYCATFTMPSAKELVDVVKMNKSDKKRKKRPDPDREEANTINDEAGGPPLEELNVEGNEDKSPTGKRETRVDSNGDEGAEGITSAKKKVKKSHGILTTESFSRLPLSEHTMKAIQEMGFEHMTQVTYHLFSYHYVATYLSCYVLFVLMICFPNFLVVELFCVYHISHCDGRFNPNLSRLS